MERAIEEIKQELARAGRLVRGARASCSRRTACSSAPSTTSRCSASWASRRASRTTRGSSTGARPARRRTRCIDYFPDDFVCFVDESHQTIPQLGGMYEGDHSRKKTLIDHGFRLPSAVDNRPLKFNEYLDRINQLVMVSATPGEFERSESSRIAEQIVRPTGIVDPEVEVRETRNQVDDLMNEVRRRADDGERTLVTTLTKKMAEDLTGYLLEHGFRVRYLHSEVDTLERIQIIRDLRLGEYDVLVGVNLLREGLDLPGGVAGRDPGRRQGGLPPRRDQPDPDDRPRRPQRQGPRPDVRGQGDPGDASGDRRDRSPPRDPARLQPRARDHAGDRPEGHLRDLRVPLDGVEDVAAHAAPRPGAIRRSRARRTSRS